jgi:uncharacterized protein
MVEVVVSKLGIDPGTQSYVVVLQEKDGARLLPIWIGQAEAESIVRHMHNMQGDRPIAHDLCRNLIIGLGATLRRVQVTHLEKGTYHGELQIERDGQVIRIDSRPSDAIAIALRLGAPIFAADVLLTLPEDDEESESEDYTSPPTMSRESSELSADQLKEYLEQLRPEDFGKFNL